MDGAAGGSDLVHTVWLWRWVPVRGEGGTRLHPQQIASVPLAGAIGVRITNGCPGHV